MIKNIFYFFFVILLSCSSAKKKIEIDSNKNENSSPEIIYKTAIKQFSQGEIQLSLDNLKKIEISYSYSTLMPKSLLMIAYIYYDSNEYINSLEYLKKYKKLYPTGKYLSYADYLTGICLYEQINTPSKDQTNTLLALTQFNKIIKNYPKTNYAEDSKIKIDLLKEILAAHEMYLAKYFIKKEKWISAILRLQIIIEKYPNTIFIEEALHRMVEINYNIGNINTAKKYAAILGHNFNSSDWYKKTYKLVEDKKYIDSIKEEKKSLKNKLFSIFKMSKND